MGLHSAENPSGTDEELSGAATRLDLVVEERSGYPPSIKRAVHDRRPGNRQTADDFPSGAARSSGDRLR